MAEVAEVAGMVASPVREVEGGRLLREIYRCNCYIFGSSNRWHRRRWWRFGSQRKCRRKYSISSFFKSFGHRRQWRQNRCHQWWWGGGAWNCDVGVGGGAGLHAYALVSTGELKPGLGGGSMFAPVGFMVNLGGGGRR